MQTPGLVAILRGPEHVFEMANPRYRELVGREVLGKRARDALPEIIGEPVCALLDRVYATGEPHEGTGMSPLLEPEDGKIFEYVYQPLRNRDGEVNGIFVHAVDVTAERGAERSLERRVDEAQLAASVGVALTSTDDLTRQLQLAAEAIVTHLEAAFARIWTLESSSDDLVLRASAGLLSIEGADGRIRPGEWKVGRIAKDREPHLTNDIAHDEEISDRAWVAGEHLVSFAGYPLIVDDHTVGVVALFARHVLDDDVISMIATIADQLAVAIERANVEAERVRALTETRQMNEELLESERQFHTLADAIPQLAWMADENGAVIWFNRQWQEYAGGGAAERARGWGWQEFVRPEDAPRVLEGVKAAVLASAPWEDSFPIRRADGTYRAFLCRARPVLNSRGKVVRWFGTATDVEDQRQAEIAARERAEFEEQLLGMVSHDLRNPLQAVLLGVQTVLARWPHEERATELLTRTRRSAERALVMVRDLLDFTAARIRGGLVIERRPMDLGRVVEQVVHETRLSFPKREIRVQREGDLQGEWDFDRLAQLVTNLVTNALKYSPEGTPVDLHVREEATHVVLDVHNAGEPIPEDKIGILFEPMQRAADERTDRSLGLGLYIVKNIVDAHGGRVDVVSTSDAGTTFTVRLMRTASK